MSRWPIRVRLTAVFAVAMAVVLLAAGLFVYLALRADLNEGVDTQLSSLTAAVAAADSVRGLAIDPEEEFAQLLDEVGAVRATTGPREPARAGEHRVPGLEGEVRVVRRGDVVAGRSLDDRDEALAGLVGALAIGGPIAVLLASMLGYALARAALRPVELMRLRAAAGDPRLPLPEADDEVRRLGVTLNEMLERERRFVADASHELRTPIAVLKAELEGMLRSGTQDPQALAAAAEEADHLAQLADDLLTLAEAREGTLPVHREPIDARELLEAARDRFSHRGRPIEVDAPHSLTLDADPLRMRQALGNLVDNALRHGAGTVHLSAREGLVEVADEGPGFPPGLSPLERFARADAARTRGGAGLGLSIVKAIAEAHGGRVELPGGSRVSLILGSGPSQEDAA